MQRVYILRKRQADCIQEFPQLWEKKTDRRADRIRFCSTNATTKAFLLKTQAARVSETKLGRSEMSAPPGLLKTSLISVPVHTCIKNFSSRSRVITFPPTNLVLNIFSFQKNFGITMFNLESLSQCYLPCQRWGERRGYARRVDRYDLVRSAPHLLFHAVGPKPGS